jgi:hypothetical protein
MRKSAVFAALFGMVLGPMAPAGAAETADIYSKNGVSGPSFARSTQCAAAYVLTMQMLGAAQPGYQNALKQGTSWLTWAGVVAEGADASAEMNRRKDAFTARTKSMNNDDYNTAIAAELQACITVKGMFQGVEPFSSNFAQGVEQSGNTPNPDTIDFNAGVDCATTYSVIAQAIGKSHSDYDFYNGGSETWTQFAIDQIKGSDKAKVDAVTKRATFLSESYTKILTEDQDAGIAKLQADRDTCKGFEPLLPKYFKNR